LKWEEQGVVSGEIMEFQALAIVRSWKSVIMAGTRSRLKAALVGRLMDAIKLRLCELEGGKAGAPNWRACRHDGRQSRRNTNDATLFKAGSGFACVKDSARLFA